MEHQNLYASPRHVKSLEECSFYHHMELPGLGEVGQHWDLRETVDQYLGRLDYSGKRVLDLGAASGFLTFSMESRGAQVVSFDLATTEDLNVVPYRHSAFPVATMFKEGQNFVQKVLNSYWFAHRLLGSKAQAFYGDVYHLPESLEMFDIVVVGMILPHLRDPFQALASACARCSGRVVLTQQAPIGEQPYALFMPNIRVNPGNIEHYFAWWALSEQCLIKMLEVLGFRIISNERCLHRCTAPTRGVDTREECLTLVAERTGP
jgi:SAM-dependent methyltransferase